METGDTDRAYGARRVQSGGYHRGQAESLHPFDQPSAVLSMFAITIVQRSKHRDANFAFRNSIQHSTYGYCPRHHAVSRDGRALQHCTHGRLDVSSWRRCYLHAVSVQHKPHAKSRPLQNPYSLPSRAVSFPPLHRSCIPAHLGNMDVPTLPFPFWPFRYLTSSTSSSISYSSSLTSSFASPFASSTSPLFSNTLSLFSISFSFLSQVPPEVPNDIRTSPSFCAPIF